MNYDLSKYIRAHERDYERALLEIRLGRKMSHWIWYIFPQIKGLGTSAMCLKYEMQSLSEARAYLLDPTLRAHLVEICEALLALEENDPVRVMGQIDARKLQSSMTLFDEATEDMDIFNKVLAKYYGGERDGKTLKILTSEGQ